MREHTTDSRHAKDEPHEMVALRVDAVSAVDKPATGRPFLILKVDEKIPVAPEMGLAGGELTPEDVKRLAREALSGIERSVGDLRRRLGKFRVQCDACGRFFRADNDCDHGRTKGELDEDRQHQDAHDLEGRPAPDDPDLIGSGGFDQGQPLMGRRGKSRRAGGPLVDPVSGLIEQKSVKRPYPAEDPELVDDVSGVIMSEDYQCPACEGSGQVDGESCQGCGGSGAMSGDDLDALTTPDDEDGPDATGEPDADDQRRTKGLWTTAMINQLPDSSFAFVTPGAQQDSKGRSVPEARHLPFRDASGRIDAPHVRAALARLNQTQIPPKAKQQALKVLLQAAHKIGISTDQEQKARLVGGGRARPAQPEIQAPHGMPEIRGPRGTIDRPGNLGHVVQVGPEHERARYDSVGQERTQDGRHVWGGKPQNPPTSDGPLPVYLPGVDRSGQRSRLR